MKRKTKTAQDPFSLEKRTKRQIRIKLIVDSISFIFTTNKRLNLSITSHGSFPSADTVFYQVNLGEPIPIELLQGAHVIISYVGSVGNVAPSISLQFVPSNQDAQKSSVGSHNYIVYETHALEIDQNGDVFMVHLAIENNQLFSKDETLRLELAIDMGHTFLPSLVGANRFFGLSFFPASPDILDDPVLIERGVDASLVPQRTPAWFKLRGTVSGTKAYTLCGWYVPSKSTEEGRNWSFNGPSSPFSAYQKCNMRFGSLREFYMIIIYLLTFPQRRFYETGWCSMKKPYPSTWGASPDGYVYDPELSVAQIPENIVTAYKLDCKKPKYDVTKGAIEFKASRNNCNMMAYYIPQVYMEMMALDTVWVDLVRYCEKSVQDGAIWRKERECRIFRIYRNKNIERVLVDTLKHALENVDTLQDLITTEHFVDLRQQFQAIANALPFRQVEITPEIEQALQRYEQYRAEKQRLSEDGLAELSDWDEIDMRNAEIHMLWQTQNTITSQQKHRFAYVVGQQLETYSRMLQHVMDT